VKHLPRSRCFDLIVASLSALFTGMVCLAAVTAPAAEPAPVPITTLAFSPDGSALVSNGPRRVDIRSPKDGSIQAHAPWDLSKITSLTFCPRGDLLAVTGGEPGVRGESRLYNWHSRTVRQSFTNDHDLATSAAFNHDGMMFGVSAHLHARIWRRANTNAPFTEAFTLSGHAGPVLAIVFSPTGRSIVTASADRSIKVWSADDGRLLRTFSQHLEAVNTLVFRPLRAPEDKSLPGACASASDDRTIRIWQPEIGRMVRIIRHHGGPIFALAYAPDGQSLFSAGKEGIIRRFDVDSDAMLSELPARGDWVYALAVSPDGTKIASGDWSGAVRLHDLRGRE
jgi:WD40 repeat protein